MPHTPQRILVPTDFSPASDCALIFAKELAGPFKAEIHLLHVRTVVDNPIVSSEDLDEVERILAMSDAKTRETLEEYAAGIEVPTHCHIERGIAPADAIIKAIAEHHCDLVVMGTNGRRGLKRLMVGSVAKEVVHRSPVPVLTTREETGRAFSPQKILVAYDSSDDSLQAVLLAAEWASVLSAEITLIHAMEPITYPDFYSHYTLRENHLTRLGQQCHDALAAVGKEHLQNVTHETAVIYAQAAGGISEYASSHGFGLVVLATRGLSGIARALFGSVAERVTQISEVPVLTVREPSRAPTETPKKKKEKSFTTFPRRSGAERDRPAQISVERSPDRTVLRLHGRESLAGTDLRLINGLWDFFEEETVDPKAILVVLAPPELLGPANLERLLGVAKSGEKLTSSEIRARIIREENVIQRYIKAVRRLDSFVIGVVSGEVALQLAAPLLACDYRIVSPDTTFVNTTQTLPRAPLGCLPWLLANLLGGAKATQLLLDVPRLSAADALALGLVNHVTAPDRLEEEAFEVAARLGSLPRATLMGLKRSMTASSDDFTTYLNHELALTEQLASPRWAEQ
jgi:nucleotide-binding universal stress UspA family protein/enoyl-CoA hydratase/carnithine racemase